MTGDTFFRRARILTACMTIQAGDFLVTAYQWIEAVIDIVCERHDLGGYLRRPFLVPPHSGQELAGTIR